MTSVHTQLLVTDFAPSFAFYRDLLGLELVHGTEDGPYAQFRVGAAMLTLVHQALLTKALGTPAGPRPADAPDDAVLVLGVDDVDRRTAELRSKGIRFLSQPADRWGMRSAHFRDPAGHLIEINQPLAK